MRKHFKIILVVLLCFTLNGQIKTFAQTPDKPVVLDTLEIRDMDINDVLKLLSAKSGLNIIAGKNISGRVTIFLQNVEVHDALTIILKSNDLAFIEQKGIVQIVTAGEYEQMYGRKFGIITESIIVPLHSIKATDAVALLSQVKSQTGKVIADDQSNSVIIEEVPAQIKKMLEYIKTLDAPTELKTYKLQYVSVDALSTKLQDMASPKIGSVKFDATSNKLFIKDTPRKLQEMDALIKQIDVEKETKVFQISYAKAEDIAKTITPVLTKDIGVIQFDTRSNTVIVTDNTPKIKEIGAIVTALDRNDKEVFIEAKIVRIDLTDQYSMGIDWEKMIPHASHQVVNLKNSFGVTGASSVTTIGTLDREEYTAVLSMIAALTNSRILSSPQVAVVNNQEASILVGDTTPYVTSATTATGSGVATTADTVNFIDTGVKLHVTPVIHEDGYVTMKIKPEVSQVTDTVSAGSGTVKNEIPVVNTSELETTIRVKDGVTIIMGGLIKDTFKNNKNKIPVLGDIPLVGKAFRSETRSSVKEEIVIFLTPHIISGDVHVDDKKYSFPKFRDSKSYFNPLPKDESTTPVP